MKMRCLSFIITGIIDNTSFVLIVNYILKVKHALGQHRPSHRSELIRVRFSHNYFPHQDVLWIPLMIKTAQAWGSMNSSVSLG